MCSMDEIIIKYHIVTTIRHHQLNYLNFNSFKGWRMTE